HLLNQAGKRVGVLSVPATYPPEPVKGFVVTGMMTPPDAADYTYPPSLAQELEHAVPAFTTAPPKGTAHPLGREAGLVDALERQPQRDLFAAGPGEADSTLAVTDHPALKLLAGLQPDELTPKEALEALYRLKGLASD
ncbi:MAG: hypothetical protein JSU71_09470, partial [Betaproteobacteria bacterium]